MADRARGGETPGDEVAPRCSFCGKERREVERLHAGLPPAWVCDECLELCMDIVGEESNEEAATADAATRAASPNIRESSLACSFCGKNRGHVRVLVAGPTDYICNECVARFAAEGR